LQHNSPDTFITPAISDGHEGRLASLQSGRQVTVGFVTYASRRYDPAIGQFEGLEDDLGLGWAYRKEEDVSGGHRGATKERT
jgi:hypothetical protein